MTDLFHTATYRGCHIRQNAADAVSRPTFGSILQTTYSCVNSSADQNCNYDVHVLSTHQGNGDEISWNNVLSTGDINVDISVNGEEHSNKSLVLVLLNHYPMNWILDVPAGVIIDRVLLVSTTCIVKLPGKAIDQKMDMRIWPSPQAACPAFYNFLRKVGGHGS